MPDPELPLHTFFFSLYVPKLQPKVRLLIKYFLSNNAEIVHSAFFLPILYQYVIYLLRSILKNFLKLLSI
jgi:hypothetical protein